MKWVLFGGAIVGGGLIGLGWWNTGHAEGESPDEQIGNIIPIIAGIAVLGLDVAVAVVYAVVRAI